MITPVDAWKSDAFLLLPFYPQNSESDAKKFDTISESFVCLHFPLISPPPKEWKIDIFRKSILSYSSLEGILSVKREEGREKVAGFLNILFWPQASQYNIVILLLLLTWDKSLTNTYVLSFSPLKNFYVGFFF